MQPIDIDVVLAALPGDASAEDLISTLTAARLTGQQVEQVLAEYGQDRGLGTMTETTAEDWATTIVAHHLGQPPPASGLVAAQPLSDDEEALLQDILHRSLDVLAPDMDWLAGQLDHACGQSVNTGAWVRDILARSLVVNHLLSENPTVVPDSSEEEAALWDDLTRAYYTWAGMNPDPDNDGFGYDNDGFGYDGDGEDTDLPTHTPHHTDSTGHSAPVAAGQDTSGGGGEGPADPYDRNRPWSGEDGRWLMVCMNALARTKKTQVLMQDLVDLLTDKLDPLHTSAWINRLRKRYTAEELAALLAAAQHEHISQTTLENALDSPPATTAVPAPTDPTSWTWRSRDRHILIAYLDDLQLHLTDPGLDSLQAHLDQHYADPTQPSPPDALTWLTTGADSKLITDITTWLQRNGHAALPDDHAQWPLLLQQIWPRYRNGQWSDADEQALKIFLGLHSDPTRPPALNHLRGHLHHLNLISPQDKVSSWVHRARRYSATATTITTNHPHTHPDESASASTWLTYLCNPTQPPPSQQIFSLKRRASTPLPPPPAKQRGTGRPMTSAGFTMPQWDDGQLAAISTAYQQLTSEDELWTLSALLQDRTLADVVAARPPHLTKWKNPENTIGLRIKPLADKLRIPYSSRDTPGNVRAMMIKLHTLGILPDPQKWRPKSAAVIDAHTVRQKYDQLPPELKLQVSAFLSTDKFDTIARELDMSDAAYMNRVLRRLVERLGIPSAGEAKVIRNTLRSLQGSGVEDNGSYAQLILGKALATQDEGYSAQITRKYNKLSPQEKWLISALTAKRSNGEPYTYRQIGLMFPDTPDPVVPTTVQARSLALITRLTLPSQMGSQLRQTLQKLIDQHIIDDVPFTPPFLE
ncbi:hypothetical protein ACFYPT_39410 [Streptomyces sp. NPDC005529]|uniref:hypothetical protein n=1 Tax=unclassified Streptomyces TaxID=2593676 RepID=UPI0033A067A5